MCSLHVHARKWCVWHIPHAAASAQNCQHLSCENVVVVSKPHSLLQLLMVKAEWDSCRCWPCPCFQGRLRSFGNVFKGSHRRLLGAQRVLSPTGVPELDHGDLCTHGWVY